VPTNNLDLRFVQAVRSHRDELRRAEPNLEIHSILDEGYLLSVERNWAGMLFSSTYQMSRLMRRFFPDFVEIG
jgi:hypothetical protein